MSITVFTSRIIHTMNPSWPVGEAVAVRDGRILEVGSLASVAPWLATDEHVVHDFGDAVILPGLIDPHLHPVMAAVLLPMHFVTALPWPLPWQEVPGSPTPGAYRQRLAELLAAAPTDEPFFTWGYHDAWHGEMSRELMDDLAGGRPMVVWHRSFHEVYLNTAMLELMGLTAEQLAGRPQVDHARGRFFETGLGVAISRLNRIIMSPAWIRTGLERLQQVVHRGGHTTVGDMAVGIFDYGLERELGRDILDQPGVPFRVATVPHAEMTARALGGHQAVIDHVDRLLGTDTARTRHIRHIKLFTDGAFFSRLSMMKPPGYVDGHHGEWLMAPEAFEQVVRVYWEAGFAIHVHCTGDLGLELALETLAKMQSIRPRFNHGFTIEHFGFSTPEQVRLIERLGASLSANVYYLFELSDRYAADGVGTERAHSMARIGSAAALGITTALHSDYPMAPATPLRNAWIAATRQNAAGDIAAPAECLSVMDALKAVTINAATVLGLQDDIGSIRAGKLADFTVIDRDPLAGGADALRDARVLATVMGGEVFPVS